MRFRNEAPRLRLARSSAGTPVPLPVLYPGLVHPVPRLLAGDAELLSDAAACLPVCCHTGRTILDRPLPELLRLLARCWYGSTFS